MDKIEKYITENREKLDKLTPGDEIWNAIDSKLSDSRPRERYFSYYAWRAAAIILFAAVLWLLADRQDSGLENELAVNNPRLEEFTQVEQYYTTLIGNKKTEIEGILAENPEFREQFSEDVEQLDSTYSGLKTELSSRYNDRIVDAMIVNLQLRIDILNQQLNILQRIKNVNEDETKGI